MKDRRAVPVLVALLAVLLAASWVWRTHSGASKSGTSASTAAPGKTHEPESRSGTATPSAGNSPVDDAKSPATGQGSSGRPAGSGARVLASGKATADADASAAAGGPAPAGSGSGSINASKVRRMIGDYHTLMGENPIGTNAEIMQAVMGRNPREAVLGPPDGLSLNGQGELVDDWGTPYFFHQLSKDRMEIRSAGPDKIFGTPDDIILK